MKQVWIAFGEHGDVTDSKDWNVDDPDAFVTEFSGDKFYTYYSFRAMNGGERFVSGADFDAVKAELEALKKTLTKS